MLSEYVRQILAFEKLGHIFNGMKTRWLVLYRLDWMHIKRESIKVKLFEDRQEKRGEKFVTYWSSCSSQMRQ